MTTVREIEKAIAELPPKKFSVLRAWIDDFEAARWDKQLEVDAQAGKFDAIAKRVRENYKNGKCKEL